MLPDTDQSCPCPVLDGCIRFLYIFCRRDAAENPQTVYYYVCSEGMRKMAMKDKFSSRKNRKQVEQAPGITRQVMSYNDDCMLCFFNMEKGAVIEPHQHKAVQNGYVISGKVRLFDKNKETVYTADAGCGYVFDSEEVHGLEVLETAEIVEAFTPSRPEMISD